MTDKPDLASDRHIDAGGRIRYFGHACLVLQTPEGSIITTRGSAQMPRPLIGSHIVTCPITSTSS